jgi:hypothetical protein
MSTIYQNNEFCRKFKSLIASQMNSIVC